MSNRDLWKRYQQHLCRIPALGLALDVSRMRFEAGFFDRMASATQRAFEAMEALERGEIANPDENRMVGHYWLRAPELARSPEITAGIRKTVADVRSGPVRKWSRASRPATTCTAFSSARAALFENDRESMTITIPRVDARVVGGLIALFDRAVGLYASLVNINAYHQPGVEAVKKAAASILALQGRVLANLSATPQTAEQIANTVGASDAAEAVYLLLEHLAANGGARFVGEGGPGQTKFTKY